MFHIKTFTKSISVAKWEDRGGGFKPEAIYELDEDVNIFLTSHTIKDIRVSTPTLMRHNNGGYDEVMIIYTILYEK